VYTTGHPKKDNKIESNHKKESSMNKQITKLIGLLACAGISTANARTISTPLPLYLGYPAAHVYYPIDDMNEPTRECGIEVDVWGAGYYRSAIDAFGPNRNNSCDPCANRTENAPIVNPITGVCTSSKRESIGALLFGADSFTIAQSFANSTVGTGVPLNPFVTFSFLNPIYEYRERGAFFGLILGKRFGCDDQWSAGIRFALPYRDIQMEETPCSNTTGETLADVFRQRTEAINAPDGPGTPYAYAARFDFLAALNQVVFGVDGTPTPMVIYNDFVNAAGQMTIASQDVTAITPTATTPFVDVIESVDGSVPASVRWADIPTNGSTAVNADGTGLSNLQRGYFSTTTNYTPLASSAHKSQLWLVPNVNSFGTIFGPAESIRNAILQAIGDLDPDVTTFLRAQGIDLCNGNRKGVGDLDAQLYAGHHCDCGFGELQLGIRIPTGKKVRSALTTVAQPLGNNGHVEIRPGLVLGTSYLDWILFKLDATYSFVLHKTEQVAAPFAGATIRNIGPSIPARVSWQYFWGEFDITFINPCNPCMGATIAYQPYVKRADKVCLPCTETRDFIGNVQTLDVSLLTNDTKRVGHTIRTEIFYNTECMNLFLGFAQVVGGSNITRDTDLYLGGFVNF
jgi:hypothetical protein